MKTKKRIRHYIKENWTWFTMVITLMVIGCLISILTAHLLRNLTDNAVAKEWNQFNNNLWSLAGVGLLGFSFKYFEKYANGRFTSACMMKIREDFMKRLLNITIENLRKQKTGDILSTYSNDLRCLQGFFQSHLTGLMYEIIMASASFIYLYMVNRKIAAALIMVIPLSILTTGFITRKIQSYAEGVQEEIGRSNVILRETVRGIHTIKMFNLERRFKNEYSDILERCVEKGVKIDRKILLMDTFVIGFQLAPYVLFCVYGAFLLNRGFITAGGLVAFLNLFDKLYMSLCEIQYTLKDIKIDRASIKRVVRVLQLPKEEHVEDHNSEAPCLEAVEFEGVNFSYKQGKELIRNLSFSVDRGETAVMLGDNGCGKSTVFKLISGFYGDYTGEIKVMGKEISRWNREKLRKRIGVVSQDVKLFPFTIEENIAFGREGASQKEIIRASKAAQAHEFIMKLPKGYKTQVSEDGSNLSGGERQRIAIARAFLKDAPILLLDEADSALDGESKEKVKTAIEKLMEGKTTLIITHRKEDVKSHHKIIGLNHQEEVI